MVVLDRFSGNSDLEDWIYKAEQYFTFLGFSEEHWLPLPSFYLDGEALEWFHWMFRNKQFFDWNHFKEKLALRFPKQTYAKFSLGDAQITRILALLQKMEDKCSSKAQQILVEDAGISATTILNGEISSPLATENSSPVDNAVSYPGLFDTSVDAHSGHVDHMFDEMSIGVFTKEVEETSSVSSFVVDSEDIQSPRVFNEFIHSCCPKTIVEVQIETQTKMVDEEAADPESNAVHLFDEYSLRDMSKRYITALSLDHGSRKQKIAFETFDDMYLLEFSLEPETIKDLYLENSFLKIEESILPGYTYTVHMNPLQLLGFTDKFCFIAYANSVNRVWDPGLQRYKMESKVHGTYSEVNRVFNDSFLRVASRAIQLITPRDSIRLPKLFCFLQRLLAQLIEGDFSFQKKINDQANALKMASAEEEVTPIFCIAWLQGCIKSTTYLIEQELHYFSRLEGDNIIDFPPTFSLYEFAALQACENDHWSLTKIESELELVKDVSIVDANIVHKSMFDESKSCSVLISSEKFKSKMSIWCCHEAISPCEISSFPRYNSCTEPSMFPPFLWNTFGDIPNVHDYVNMKRVMEIVGLSKKELMVIFRIVASVMVLGNMGFSKGNEIVCFILQVDSIWFQLRTTIAAIYIHSSLGRFNIILSVWLYSNLEDKVLIEDESIVMNQVQPNIDTMVTQVIIGLKSVIGLRTNNRARLIWDPGRVVDVRTIP